LDLDVRINRCQDLPAAFASDVILKFDLPSHIYHAVLPDDFDRSTVFSPQQVETLGKRGGSFSTSVLPRNVDVLNCNPDIEYHKTFRILDLNFRTREWFKTASLMLEVFGEPPNLDLGSGAAATNFRSATQAGNVRKSLAPAAGARLSLAPRDNKKTAAALQKLNQAAEKKNFNDVKAAATELSQQVAELTSEVDAKTQDALSLSQELEAAKARAKKAEEREQERERQLQNTSQRLVELEKRANMSAPEQIRELQAKLKAAEDQAARDREELQNAKSSSCVVS